MIRTYRTPEIHCHSCAGLIQETLEEVKDIRSVTVDVTHKTVTIDFADGSGEERAIELLAHEGYSTQPVSV